MKNAKPPYESPGERPINLINCTGKLAEKVVADELQEIVYLHRHQFGAVKGRSAIDALARVTTIAQKSLRSGKQVTAKFKDVRSAFGATRLQGLLEAIKGLHSHL